jgi:hypothetical protein
VAQTGWEETVDPELKADARFAAHLVKPVDWGTLDRLLESVAPPLPPDAS